MQELPITNPVYLMLGTSFGSSAKGTGLKALEFALSICDSVDMYGFTVDPGYKEWLVTINLMLINCKACWLVFFFLQLILCVSGQGTFQSPERVTLHCMVEHIIK
jgi:hypothetical protein